jgi:hypothetical protein
MNFVSGGAMNVMRATPEVSNLFYHDMNVRFSRLFTKSLKYGFVPMPMSYDMYLWYARVFLN